MKRDAIETILEGTHGAVRIQRLEHGFPSITAREDLDLFYGLGYAHGRDRQMHMWLMKLAGQGRASECLRADDELVEADRFMRWLDFAGEAAEEAQELAPPTKMVLEAYCRGVNDAVAATGRPFEFKLFGYTPEAWTPADVLLIAKLIAFVGLSQVQGDAEKFIIQLLHAGQDARRVKELFPAIREEIPASFIELIKQIRLVRPIIPSSVPWRRLVPGLAASNNWAVRPNKTASGAAMLCADPHLAFQLPATWYLAVLSTEERYWIGATLPGLPFVIMGRSRHLSWAATYGTADVCDYFIEEVKDGKYRRGDTWRPFTVREETLHPKKKAPLSLRFYENEHGILEGEPEADGYYLCYAWAAKQQKGTLVESLENMYRFMKARNADEARDYFAGLTFASFNWIFADLDGNIGYQLGGLVPRRAPGTSGLLPYRGWDASQDWDGMLDPRTYPRAYNPDAGFIITANQDLNHLGQTRPMNLPMSGYRADRIRDLLSRQEALTVETMKQIHYDRYALQAEAFMAIIRPLLPETEPGVLLRDWDLHYEADAVAATLFEHIYQELILLVFGEKGFGRAAMTHLMEETSLFALLHGHFDRVLLSESSAWFGDQARETLYATAIERGLQGEALPHGEARTLYVEHLLFGGKLPRFLGFDYRLSHIGSRSTIPQAQVFKASSRQSSFAATFRMICDFADDTLHTNIAGGASDRRFSPYYTAGLPGWERGTYDILRPGRDP